VSEKVHHGLVLLAFTTVRMVAMNIPDPEHRIVINSVNSHLLRLLIEEAVALTKQTLPLLTLRLQGLGEIWR